MGADDLGLPNKRDVKRFPRRTRRASLHFCAGEGRPPRIGDGRSDTRVAMRGAPGAPSFLSPLSWTHAGDALDEPSAVSERGSSGSGAGTTDDHRSIRQRAIARVKARPPKFLTAVRRLLREAPSLCPTYSANPLLMDVCEPCDEDTRELARRWARDATALSDWKSLPPQLDVTHPEGGGVPRARGARKREQLRNVFLFVAPLLRRKPTAKVVDFGCGGGHQTLPLAYHFPDATFVLVDAKARSLEVAERRAAAAGLRNVRCVLGFIEDFDEDFDVGVALHACGGASDAAMDKCVEVNAAYVVAPCCVGKIALAATAAANARETGGGDRNAKSDAIDNRAVDAAGGGTAAAAPYPRSALAASVITAVAYVSIAQAADFGGEGYDACGAVSGGPGPYVDSSEEDEDDERDASGFLASIGEDAAVAGDDADHVPGSIGGGAIAPTEALERRAETNLTPGLAAYLRAKAEKRERRKNRAPRSDPSLFAERETQRRACKAVVEADRNASAAERGYETWQVLMEPPGCTPKNDVLVGIPSTDPDCAAEFGAALRRRGTRPAEAFFRSLLDEE